MRQDILDKIRSIKEKYEPEGFVILGVFGSYARGDEKSQSDIDILYRINDIALTKYPGWAFFSLYERVKSDLQTILNTKVDLADSDALGPVGKKYILPETIYVN